MRWPWVTWESSAHQQNVFYLHGGLHIFEDGPEIKKYTWCNTGVPLIDQIRSALEQNKYPLFVAEGTADQKMSRIIRSSFLGRAYRSFENIGGSLFVYGMSLGDSDRHILRAIVRSKVRKLFVSLRGDPSSESKREIVEKAEKLSEDRNRSGRTNPLEVHFFDADSAAVWSG